MSHCLNGKWRFCLAGGIAASIIMFADLISTGMGLFGGGESAGPAGSGGVPPESSSATAVSGGPFASGGVMMGGTDTKTILIIGAIALAAIFFLKR